MGAPLATRRSSCSAVYTPPKPPPSTTTRAGLTDRVPLAPPAPAPRPLPPAATGLPAGAGAPGFAGSRRAAPGWRTSRAAAPGRPRRDRADTHAPELLIEVVVDPPPRFVVGDRMANEEPLDRVLLPGEQTVTHEKPTCKRYLRELCGDREDVVGGGRLLASNRSNSGLELTFVVLANSAHGANDEQGCGSRLEPRPFWAPSKPRTPRRGGPRGAQCGAARAGSPRRGVPRGPPLV